MSVDFIRRWSLILNTHLLCLSPVRPLNSKKRVMLLGTLTSSSCQNSSACSIFFPTLLLHYLTHRHLPSKALTQPFLISFCTLSYKEGRRWREGGRSIHTVHYWPSISVPLLSQTHSLFCAIQTRGLLSPTNSLFRILSNALNFCRAAHIKAHSVLWELRVLQGTGSLW